MSAVFPIEEDFESPIEFSNDRQVAQLRVPPHSVEAESSVLGGLLLDNSAWDRVGDLVSADDYYRHEHQLIFSAIAVLINANKPADVITVFEQLQSQGKADEVGGCRTSIPWHSTCPARPTSAVTPRSCVSGPSCASSFP